MKFGLGGGAGPSREPTEQSISLVDFARAAEDHGFDSISFGEHTHIPVHNKTAFPEEAMSRTGMTPGPDGQIPASFAYFWDPIVAAAVAATATTTLKVAFGVLLVPQRDPIILAQEISTLDQLSGGRVIFGVGTGWLDEELENHGVDPRHRTAVLMERVRAIKEIWTNDVASFHGKYVDFDEIWQWPKPFQKPHPPILLGGYGPGILKRVIDLGAEWLAPATRMDAAGLRVRIEELDHLVKERGAPRVRVTFVANAEPHLIEELIAMGVDRCLVGVHPGEPSEVIKQIKQLERMIAPFRT